MAAGATVGSNHNSRTNDGEIVAGRGFWPGLCSSVKHSSRFACYTLLAKGDFPAELDIPLPFSLVNNNVTDNCLEIIPAYWWLYNMYALARNSWKYKTRDKRITKVQNIEFDTFAPDTMSEVLRARKLLEVWVGKACCDDVHADECLLQKKGRQLLCGDRKAVDTLTVLGEGVERSRRPVHILKVYDAYHAYGDMLIHYAMSSLLAKEDNASALKGVDARRTVLPDEAWVNMGGQLMPEYEVDCLRADIRDGRLDSWEDIHKRYDEIWNRYTVDKWYHAYACLCTVLDAEVMTPELWLQALAHEERIQRRIAEQVYVSRKKDHDNPFRACTCRNEEELQAVFGSVDDNSFVRQMREECCHNLEIIDRLRAMVTV